MVKKLLIVSVAFAGLAMAQGKSGSKGGSSGAPMGAAAPTKFDQISGTLNLNKDQKKAVKEILDEGAKEAAPIRDQIGKSRIVVGDAILGNKGEDELKQVARASSDLSAQLSEVEIRTFGKVFATLDDTQKKDMRSLSRVLIVMNGIYHNKNWNEE